MYGFNRGRYLGIIDLLSYLLIIILLTGSSVPDRRVRATSKKVYSYARSRVL